MSVVLTLRYHDSEPGGGICKDDADAKAEAAKVAREVLNDLADEGELEEQILAALAARDPADAPNLGAAMTVQHVLSDESAEVDTDLLTDDEALDIAAELMAFEWDTLPGEPEPTGPTPVVVIAAGVRCALAVIEAWEDGDLAAAVRELADWTRDARKDFPDLDLAGAPGCDDEEVSLCVLDIKPGDRVDLKGVYDKDSVEANAAEFEYGRVIGGERETDDCMRLDFENFPSFGFEAWRDLPVIKGSAADRLFYNEGEA
jgi:DNA-directed RNA polymerase subunit F